MEGEDAIDVSIRTFNLMPRGEFVELRDLQVTELVTSALQLILVVAVILFLFSFLLGALKMILSFGKKERIDEAKRQLINAIIGLVIVLSSWAIMNFIGFYFGVDLTNIQVPTI